MTESAVNIDFGTLFGDVPTSTEPRTALEAAIESELEVLGSPGAASPIEKFQFRSLLTDEQLASMKAGAPKVAKGMVADLNKVITFGAPVMAKLNTTSSKLLDEQRHIKLPEADEIVNDLLREIHGYEKKFRNSQLEGAIAKLRTLFKKNQNSFKAMVREAKPIADRLDIAEVKLLEMEIKLGDNITRAQIMHKAALDNTHGAVGVLAALEEVIEIVGDDVRESAKALAEAEASGSISVMWQGQPIPIDLMRENHANLITALSEIEKTWHDWRQQFFMAFANAPAGRNLVMMQFSMRRRLASLRTMGIPQNRQALAQWQQAQLAREGAEMGDAVQRATNLMIQKSAAATADSVAYVANAAQAPIITDDTVWAVIDSIRDQCRAIAAADKAGRALRERNLKALQQGELIIRDEFAAMQAQLASQALAGR